MAPLEFMQPREEGNDEPDGRMEPAEFLVSLEREVQMHALQVRPSVTPTAEDSVVGGVDPGVGVGPDPSLGLGIHEGSSSHSFPSRVRAGVAGLHPALQGPDDLGIQLPAQDLVLHPGFDARVVVHLEHHRAPVHLLSRLPGPGPRSTFASVPEGYLAFLSLP